MMYHIPYPISYNVLGCPYTADDEVRVYFILCEPTSKRDPITGSILVPPTSSRFIPYRGWVTARVTKVDKGQVQVQIEGTQCGHNKSYSRWFHSMSDEIKRIGQGKHQIYDSRRGSIGAQVQVGLLGLILISLLVWLMRSPFISPFSAS